MKTILLFLMISTSIFANEISISRFRGDVTLNGVKVTEGQIVKVGQKIKANGIHSFVQVVYEDGNQILIKNGSMIVHKSKKGDNSVKLLNGMGFYSIDKDKKEKFKVHTRYASFAVRGTKFFIQATKEDAYLCVCEGIVTASNKSGSKSVKAKEDIRMTKSSSEEPTVANEAMWDMTVAGFALMGIPIK